MAKSSTLGLTAGTRQVREFHCRNCDQPVHESMKFCPNCAEAIDLKEFSARMDAIGKTVQARTHLGYLKAIAGAIVLFYIVSWIPVVDMVGYWACLVLLIALPLLILAWWLRYGFAKADDADLKRAKRSTRVPIVIWVVMLVVWIVAPILYLEYQLKNLSKDPSAIVAFKDVDDAYWAVPCARIKERKGHTIVIDEGTFIAKASEDAPSKRIAEILITKVDDLYGWVKRGGPTVMELPRTADRDWSMKSELTKREMEVEIDEVLRIKPTENSKDQKYRMGL